MYYSFNFNGIEMRHLYQYQMTIHTLLMTERQERSHLVTIFRNACEGKHGIFTYLKAREGITRRL